MPLFSSFIKYFNIQYTIVDGNMPLQPCKNAKNKWTCIYGSQIFSVELPLIVYSFLVVSSTHDISRLARHYLALLCGIAEMFSNIIRLQFLLPLGHVHD